MLSFVFWCLVTISTIVILAYRSIELRESTITLGLLLTAYTILGDPTGLYLVLLWVTFGLLVSLNIPEIRQIYYSARILKIYRSGRPKISKNPDLRQTARSFPKFHFFRCQPTMHVVASVPPKNFSNHVHLTTMLQVDLLGVHHLSRDRPQKVKDGFRGPPD